MECMTSSPVHVEISSPPVFDRVQVLLRVLLTIVLGWLGMTAGWLVWSLYLLLPVIAAISVSLGGDRFRVDVAPRIAAGLAWLLALSAYMMLLTDRFPAGVDTNRIELPITGRPTVGSALARLVTSLPSGIVLLVLWFVSAVLWLVAAAAVIVGAAIPAGILGYQRGVLRWQARLVAYHASLVDDYPPLAIDTNDADHTTLTTSEAR